jgi:hypothetical protein
MKHLLIPDVHERMDKLDAILETHLDNADRVVFMGDWFDSFQKFDAARIVKVCRFINESVDTLISTWLLGNHDCHYFFRHAGFVCSGYDPRKKAFIEELIQPDTIRKFKLHTRIGPWLISHAGYHHTNVHMADDLTATASIDRAIRGEFPRIFSAGRARGGDAEFGGPTWLDFNYEFEHIDGIPQIVGHTNGAEVRFKDSTGKPGETITHLDRSWCIDTALKHCAIIDDETNAIEIIENT